MPKRGRGTWVSQRGHVVHVAEVETGSWLWSTSGHSKYIEASTLSPDGHFLATSSDDCTMQLWRTTDGMCLAREAHPTKGRAKLAFSDDGEVLAIGARDGTVSILRTRNYVDAT